MAKFYITTAIDYANSTPHLGTAYEKIGADVIARYRRLCGDDVKFVMGNDEHSQNVRKKAQEQGVGPKEYCDQMAEKFKETWKELCISNDTFIQTSSPKHHEMVREIARRIHGAKDSQGRPVIFKGAYEGPYCVSCEAFYQEKDLNDGLCPIHKTKPEWLKEENYYFRLSTFTESLKKHFATHVDFLRPVSRRNEILALLERGLEDISISRPNKDWGVKLPFDESAVAYVWFDALINYMSAVGPVDSSDYKRFWPADLHVIGKDITRFHSVIWPAMLMAIGLPLPKSVWAHGFVSMSGQKMSKSLGNVTDPLELARKYGADALRYHLMREVPWDRDGDFAEERLVTRYNADLANDLGNLMSRTLTMVHKYIGSELKRPAKFSMNFEIEQIESVVANYRSKMDHYAIDEALNEVWKLVSESNVLIDQKQPWTLAKDSSNREVLEELFYVLAERLRWSAILLLPVMPVKMAALLEFLGMNANNITIDSVPAPGKTTAYTLKTPVPLFPRLT